MRFQTQSIVKAGIKAFGKLGLREAGQIIGREGLVAGSKTVATKMGVAKLTGSVSRSAVRSWMGRQGMVKAGEIMHHWGIAVNSKVGKWVPDIIKNQPWNYLRITGDATRTASEFHNALHGVGDASKSFNDLEGLFYGTPSWAKNAAASGIGHGISIFGPNH